MRSKIFVSSLTNLSFVLIALFAFVFEIVFFVPEARAAMGFACGMSSVMDADSNLYSTVTIGSQCWLKENMMTTKYPDGAAITRGPATATWDATDHTYYAYPPNVAGTAEESLANIQSGKLGFVYQWSAAMHGSTTSGAQGICPSGWHVPTHDEFTTLERAVCTSGTCATDFPFDNSTTGWLGTNEGSRLSMETSGGNNLSGFTAHLAGYRGTTLPFYGRSSFTYFWSSSSSGGNAWGRTLNSGNAAVYRYTTSKANGFSVRCVYNTSLLVNGSCGSANGTTVSSAPASNLCAAGTASAVTGTGAWSWSCLGLGGGSTAVCGANTSNFTCGTSTLFGSNGDTNTYGTVTGADGNCWMDRNLGATRVATTYNDSAAYGWFYQWGRGTDGHQLPTSVNTSTLSSADSPGNANFIMAPAPAPYDWRIPQNGNLWQGVAGINNPCPSGFRVPTQTEWSTLVSSAGITNAATGFNSNLKLSLTYYHNYKSGISPEGTGSAALFWSSSIANVTYANYFYIDANEAHANAIDYAARAYGFPVRCIKNVSVVNGSCGSANGATVSSAPASNLCAAGTASAVTGTGAWSWSCLGLGGGSTAVCGANTSNFTCGTSTLFGSNGDTNTYGTVTGADGNCWLDRNLGASRVATSKTDASAYGWYYQWGRGTDGHQISTNGTTSTLSSLDIPGHSNFILNSTLPKDWRNPQNNNLWQGFSGTNNPCPGGFRLPTQSEWLAFITAIDSSDCINNNCDDPFYASTLKLPVSGYRDGSSGSFSVQGGTGFYWASDVRGTWAYDLSFGWGGRTVRYDGRAFGFPVRCIKGDNGCAANTCVGQTCDNGINPLTPGTKAPTFSSYNCAETDAAINAFCAVSSNCGLNITTTSADFACTAANSCTGSLSESRPTAECTAQSIPCPSVPKTIQCPGCPLRIKQGGFKEVAP